MRIANPLLLLSLAGLIACGDSTTSPDDPLALTTTSLPNGTVGVAYSTTIVASGGSGSGYAWTVSEGSLPSGLDLAEAGTPSAALRGTPGEAGTFDFTVKVTDDAGASIDRDFTIEISDERKDLAIVTTELPDARVGEAYDADVIAADGSNEGYRWSLAAGGLPPGLTFEATGTPATTISGTPAEAGSYELTLRVEDSEDASAEQTLTIVVLSDFAIETSSLAGGTVGQRYEQSITASGGSGAGFEWTVVSGALPDGVLLGANGTPATMLAGTPQTAGDFTFRVEVADSDGNTAQATYSITISPEPIELEALAAELPVGLVGEAYTATVGAIGGSGAGYTWSLVGGEIPPGLTFAASGTPETSITGVPTTIGTYEFALRVEDSEGDRDTQQFTIEIDRLVVPIQIRTSSVPPGVADAPYEAIIETVPGSGLGVSYNWIVLGGALPPGLTLEPSGTPSTRILGTPTAGGTYTATIAVFDQDNSSDSAVYVFEISQPVEVLTTALPIAQLGTPYSAAIDGLGGSNAGFTWSVVQGALPQGLTLAANGTPSTTLGGTPSESGDFSFTVELRDDQGGVDTQDFRLSVLSGLTITTTAAPPARRGVTYSATIDAVGGSGTGYSWAVTAGALPDGLTLSPAGTPSATIDGVPTVAGIFDFTVQVTDSNLDTATVDLQIEVGATMARYVAMIGDMTVDGRTDIVVAGIPGLADPAPVTVNPISPGGNGATSASYTQLSPDGSKIAFRGDFITDGVNELFVVDLSGASPGTAQRVNGNLVSGGDITEFKWSPDSTRLAYQADQDEDGVTHVWVVDVSGPTPGPSQQVSGPMVTGGDVQSDDFTWSPDGSYIAYQADQLVDNDLELFVVDVGGPIPGVSQRVNGPLPVGADTEDRWVWTPDGTRIIYQADQDTLDVLEIYIVDVSGATPSAPQKINGTLVSSGDVGTTDTDIAVSADGVWVAYVADQNTDTDEEVFVVDISGAPPSASVRVSGPAQSFTDNINLAWSPVNTQLFYVSAQDADDVYEVFLVDLISGTPAAPVKIHPSFPAFGRVAAGAAGSQWSPDGTKIAYRADTAVDNSFEVMVVDVSGATPGAPIPASPPPATDATIDEFVWAPDSARIAVRGEGAVLDADQAFVTELVGPNAGTITSVTGVPVAAGGAVQDILWASETYLLVNGDLLADGVDEAFMIDVTNPVIPPAPLHPPLPAGGDVATIVVR